MNDNCPLSANGGFHIHAEAAPAIGDLLTASARVCKLHREGFPESSRTVGLLHSCSGSEWQLYLQHGGSISVHKAVQNENTVRLSP